MTSQDQFEQSYSEFTGHPVAFIKLHRLSNDSYSVPRVATAYTWWKRSRAVAVELPEPAWPEGHDYPLASYDPVVAAERARDETIAECRDAISAAGLTVKS